MLVLAGDAGLGKTRLARELRLQATRSGMPVLWGSCSEADLSLPYLPFLEAVGNHLARVDRAALGTRLGPARRDLGRLFPQLEMEAPPDDPSDPVQSKLRLFEAVLALLVLTAADRGAVVVIEDLHWADDSSRELLDYLVRRIGGHRLLLVATCRTEELDRRHPLAVTLQRWERTGVAMIRLRPLAPDQVGRMLEAIVGATGVRAEVRNLFHRRSEGNPYALEEMVKEALDRGDMRRGEPSMKEEALVRTRLPQTVRDAVVRRIERLPAGAAALIQAAAVLGRSCRYRTLMAVSGLSQEELESALRTCMEQQLLEDDPDTQSSVRFRHALTRDAVYEDLLTPRREALHALAAEVLTDEPSAAPVDKLHHLLEARRWEEAVPLALEAARRAMEAHAYSDAAHLVERVLPFLRDLKGRGELLGQLGEALLLAGDAARAERHLRDAIALLETEGSPRAARARLWLGRCHWERNQSELARAEYERARSDLEAAGPSEDLATAYVRLAQLAIFDLDGEATTRLAQHAIDIAEAARADGPRIWAYNYLGLGLVQLREVDRGLEWLDRSYREAAAKGLNMIAANALFNDIQVRIQHLRPLEAVERLHSLESLQAGSMTSLQTLRAAGQLHLWGLGNPAKALAAYQSALNLAREGDGQYWEMWLRTHMAVALAQLDRPEQARQVLPGPGAERQDRVVQAWARIRLGLDMGARDEAVDEALRTAAQPGLPLRVRLYLGDVALEALIQAGRSDDARRLLEEIEAQKPDADNPWLLRMRGRVAAMEGRPTDAIRALAQAQARFRTAGAKHEQATTSFVLAEVLQAEGQESDAIELYRGILADAREREAALDERRAREALANLGEGVSADRVREALENLHEATLALSPLARGFAGASGDAAAQALRRLLMDLVEEVATSPNERDAEAGRLLKAYYVKRVGSQEVVAERMHLTRATFYRRLHRGWEIIAERLRERPL